MAEPATPPAVPPSDTKVCDSCDAVIGKSEKDCPKCGVNFEELEDAVTTLTKAQEVIDKRKAKVAPVPDTPPAPPAPPKKVSALRGLGAAMRKRAK
jgi:RNA polymerase subunit RPABC4/transcription elongation factor Spt4